MPLAIIRKKVKDLPLKFTLNDSMAMNPAMKLSNFPKVVIGARISKSGNAMPQSGDMQGTYGPVAVKDAKGIEVVINQTIQ
jgi:cytochrome c-type biogenesis protein CcmH